MVETRYTVEPAGQLALFQLGDRFPVVTRILTGPN
jgi:hypothetical protein